MHGNKWDDLPEPVIRNIQSFLPKEELIRSCLLSKSWLHALGRVCTASRPLIFQRPSTITYLSFLDIIHQTLLRYLQNENLLVEHLDICIGLSSNHPWIESPLASLFTEWLRLAIQRGALKLLRITMETRYLTLPSSWPLVDFPSEVLSMGRHSCLQILDLQNVLIYEDTIHVILSSFPLLEDIILFQCKGFGKIKISHLRFLRMFEIKVASEWPVEHVEIVAPSLRSFTYMGHRQEKLKNPLLGLITIDASPHLLYLTLTDVDIDERLFNEITSKFTYLRHLILKRCDLPKRIDIRTHFLGELTVEECTSLESLCISYHSLDKAIIRCSKLQPKSIEVISDSLSELSIFNSNRDRVPPNLKVHAPNLLLFCYGGSGTLPAFPFTGTVSRQLKMKYLMSGEVGLCTNWFMSLMKVLKNPCRFVIKPDSIDLCFPSSLKGNDQAPIVNVEELWLDITDHCEEGFFGLTAMEAFFMICHPLYGSVTWNTPTRGTVIFLIKFLYELFYSASRGDSRSLFDVLEYFQVSVSERISLIHDQPIDSTNFRLCQH